MSPFLKGERVLLRQLTWEHCENMANWLNDQETNVGNSHHVYPVTYKDEVKYIKHTKDFVLGIFEKGTRRHIGNVALQNIHPVYRSADFSIIIGEKDYWGRVTAKRLQDC
jgi:RimJ/RimL family protein N-acetyltransferase